MRDIKQLYARALAEVAAGAKYQAAVVEMAKIKARYEAEIYEIREGAK